MQLNPPSDQHSSLPTATFDQQCLTLSILSLLVLADPASLDQRGHVSSFCGTFFSRPSRRVTLFILQSIQRGPVCSQWARTCITENRTHLHLYCLKAGWIGIRPSSMSTRLFFYSQDRRVVTPFSYYFLLRLRIRACTYVRMWGMTVYDISDSCFHFQLYLSWSYAFAVSYFCADVFLS